ncbi:MULTISPECIES: universal stress protein [unclassified Streptomyces]|uniref:universal stress protein n=1 Tax=unclassified Streptomyces TaxID=2593676 RepID=UPI0022528FCC|nr:MULTISPECIES: universal stress protein [unclassified Streptomyces]MCX4784940.1 universal stress protein [Streptomyces sp. NBC_01221]MCX4799107.1 universal stress protein [Streptomyces sp. NBC_01242]WSJ40304.1 universal stress protein [Streptomyces sp. NBC_01321]WSP66608.1 universal stress protein [Streptomyces sp. NBC_01240]
MKHLATVGLDGSPESRAAADRGAQKAPFREVLRLVHVTDRPIGPAIRRLGRETASRRAGEAPGEALKDVHRRHQHPKVVIRWLPGKPVAAPAAEANDADLLVLGSCGLGGLVGFLAGAVGTAPLVATETPVALVWAADIPENTGPGRYDEMVVGTDIHGAPDEVLALAFEETARRVCALRAVHGWNPTPAHRFFPFLDSDDERVAGRSSAQMLDALLLPWRRRFPSVSADRIALMGSAGRQPVQAAAGADLVVGRHLRRSPPGARFRQVTHAVLHHTAARTGRRRRPRLTPLHEREIGP